MSGDSSDVSGGDDSAGAPGVKGEMTVLVSVSECSFSTTDVGPSTSWELLSNNSNKLWCIRNFHVIILFSTYMYHSLFSCCNLCASSVCNPTDSCNLFVYIHWDIHLPNSHSPMSCVSWHSVVPEVIPFLALLLLEWHSLSSPSV